MMPAPRTLELFYDVLSPYSWLGFEVTLGAPSAGAWRARAEARAGAGRGDRSLVKGLALPDGV